MKKFFKLPLLTVTLFSLLTLFSLPILVKASSTPGKNSGSTFTDLQQQLNTNLKQQSDLQKKISDSQNQEKTLANQITYMDSQIQLTGLQIDETQNRIAQLAIDVADTTAKLDQTQKDLDHKTQLANDRVKAIYEQGYVKPLEILLGTDGFNNYLLLQKYTDAIHNQDVKLITSLKNLKDTYNQQKTDLSNQKKDAEDLTVQLQNQQNSLAGQKDQEASLLAYTQNNEQVYQQSLAQAKLDQQMIQQALFNLGTRLGPVNRGDIIAYQGNSGCSTGTHLHFGYLVGGHTVDPMPYLNNGTLRWPENNPYITQGFGANVAFYASIGISGGHNGIDMTAGWGAPIYAAQSGTAYLGGDNGCPSAIPGTGAGKGIIIDGGNGTKTVYWHIQ